MKFARDLLSWLLMPFLYLYESACVSHYEIVIDGRVVDSADFYPVAYAMYSTLVVNSVFEDSIVLISVSRNWKVKPLHSVTF